MLLGIHEHAPSAGSSRERHIVDLVRQVGFELLVGPMASSRVADPRIWELISSA